MKKLAHAKDNVFTYRRTHLALVLPARSVVCDNVVLVRTLRSSQRVGNY